MSTFIHFDRFAEAHRTEYLPQASPHKRLSGLSVRASTLRNSLRVHIEVVPAFLRVKILTCNDCGLGQASDPFSKETSEKREEQKEKGTSEQSRKDWSSKCKRLVNRRETLCSASFSQPLPPLS